MKRALLALVIFFHVGGGWALTQVEPVKLIVGDVAPMEVRMVPAEQPAQPDRRSTSRRRCRSVTPPPPELATVDRTAAARPAAAGLPGRGAAAPAAAASRQKPQAAAAQAGAEAAADAAGAGRRPAAAGRTGGSGGAQDGIGFAAGLSRAAQPDLSGALAARPASRAR